MPKGNKCPNCGAQTFHHAQGAMSCNSCGARGWLNGPDSMGPGKGAKCHFCGRAKMKVVATLSSGTSIRYCYECGATVFT